MLLAPTSAMAVAPTFDYDYLDLGRVSLSDRKSVV